MSLMDRLPEILRLRVVAGMSAEETGRALGMPPWAVRVAQHRAFNTLRGLAGHEATVGRGPGFARHEAKVERALELRFLDLQEAQVDSEEAAAFGRLVQSVEGEQRACVRIGSLLLLKYNGQLIGRKLSQVELHALHLFPAIQQHPETLLGELAAAVNQLEAADKQPLE
jgi:hypothetical protein